MGRCSDAYKKKYYIDNRERILAARKLRYENNREKHNQQSKEWGLKNPEKRRASSLKNRLRDKYGLTVGEYEKLRTDHNHKCAICKLSESESPGKILHVDHISTSSGPKIRGMLCGNCNRAIGILQDNPEICLAAASYLRERG